MTRSRSLRVLIATSMLAALGALAVLTGIAGAQRGSEPSAPKIASLSTSEGAIEVNWSASHNDGGSPILGYELVFRSNRRGEGSTRTGLLTDGSLTHIQSGLSNGTEYHIRVRARNAHGASDWSARRSIRVGTPGQPKNLSVVPVPLRQADPGNLHELVAAFRSTWQVPTNLPQAAITKFIVRFRTYGSGETWCEHEVPTETAYNRVAYPWASGLTQSDWDEDASTELIFMVRAVSEHGEGPWSESVRVSYAELAPASPVIDSVKVRAQRARVKWTQPAGGAKAQSYKVSYAPADSPSDARTVTTRKREAVIKGLTPSVEYTFKVQARNDAGESGWSEPVTKLQPHLLAAPSISHVVQYQDGFAIHTRIDWVAANPTNQQLSTRYRLSGSDSEWLTGTTMAGEAIGYVWDLDANTEYEVQVQASADGVGASPWSESTLATTKKAMRVPGNVTGFKTELLSDPSGIKLLWNAPAADSDEYDRTPTSYELRFEHVSSKRVTIVDGITATSYTLIQAQGQREQYQVRVRARNGAGPSPAWSTPWYVVIVAPPK